jgi:hypothetical protein
MSGLISVSTRLGQEPKLVETQATGIDDEWMSQTNILR